MSSLFHLFTCSLLAENPAMADQFQEWSWKPGMGFQDDHLWWGEEKKRIAPHEGIDFVQYLDRKGTIRKLACGLVVPSIFSGEIVRSHRDFLAWSLYIRHPQFKVSGHVLYTVYGHLQPGEKISVGLQLAAGEVVGHLEKYPHNRTVPLHLHFTVAWVAERVSPEQLDWQMLNGREQVTLVDPRKEFHQY